FAIPFCRWLCRKMASLPIASALERFLIPYWLRTYTDSPDRCEHQFVSWKFVMHTHFSNNFGAPGGRCPTLICAREPGKFPLHKDDAQPVAPLHAPPAVAMRRPTTTKNFLHAPNDG